MRKVFLYLTMSLDGFIAGPQDELDWMLDTADAALNDDILSLMRASDAGFSRLPGRPGHDPVLGKRRGGPGRVAGGRQLADAINRLHRIVISRQPVDLPWDNSELIVAADDDALAAAVTKIKEQPGGALGVPGGVRTAQRFARLGLVDEYVLHVHPVTLGAGKPLFTQKSQLRLIGATSYDSGVLRLRYQPGS